MDLKTAVQPAGFPGSSDLDVDPRARAPVSKKNGVSVPGSQLDRVDAAVERGLRCSLLVVYMN